MWKSTRAQYFSLSDIRRLRIYIPLIVGFVLFFLFLFPRQITRIERIGKSSVSFFPSAFVFSPRFVSRWKYFNKIGRSAIRSHEPEKVHAMLYTHLPVLLLLLLDGYTRDWEKAAAELLFLISLQNSRFRRRHDRETVQRNNSTGCSQKRL